ncbi:MAG: hypothetical protein HY423_02950 [Candidatus Lambdaproteobacteria bacterium]|nr:hypothetical protein [Candidatus Lambdaproteobacteria bacterium]
MATTASRRPSAVTVTLAPIATGLAFALGRELPQGLHWQGIALQSPLVQAFLAGVLISFACRPPLARIAWSRAAAVGVAAALLLGIGPLPSWALAQLADALAIVALPYTLPRSAWPDLLGALLAAATLGLLLRPAGGTIGWASLVGRWRMRSPGTWLRWLGGLGLAAAALALAAGWLDTLLVAHSQPLLAPLLHPNPWLRLREVALGGGGAPSDGVAPLAAAGVTLAGALRAGALLLLLALRGVALVVPLVPLALVVRATPPQLALVFGIELFILGEFVPLMLQPPYPSTLWLIARTGLGLAQATALAAAAAIVLGEARPPATPPAADYDDTV